MRKKTWGLASVIGLAIGILLFASPSISRAVPVTTSVSDRVDTTTNPGPTEITLIANRWTPLGTTPGGPDSGFHGYTATIGSEDANLANLRDVMGGSTAVTFSLGNEISAPVPEPSTILFVVTAILGLTGWSLWRNKRAA